MSRTARLNRSILKSTPEQIRAVQGLRRSSAASKHDSTPKRQRTRADAKRAAIRGGE